eukprot:gb/GEZN01010779.1/.p1 GENE.gb/GEZN01010779.1/~~gb/GEZN01010779.1/.p1  ORF type:complete len:330 (-),score=6.61 gb/GEZN01010779.1/:177-1166(-)
MIADPPPLTQTDKPTNGVQNPSRNRAWRERWAGAVAGCISRCCVSPFDVLKIRYQVGSRGDVPYRGLIHTSSAILKREGLKAFWKGNLAGVLMWGPYTSIAMQMYHLSYRRLLPYFDNKPHELQFCSGAIAGASATVGTYPLDIIRTTLVVQRDVLVRPTITLVTREIVRQHGLCGLYRGMGATLMGIMPCMGLQFAIYGWFKDAFAKLEQLPAERIEVPLLSPNMPISPKALAGFLAGVGSKSITMPLEVVKKRMQTSHFAWAPNAPAPKYSSIRDCVQHVYYTEGLTAFWRGVVPNMLKAGIASCSTFVTFEVIMLYALPVHGGPAH